MNHPAMPLAVLTAALAAATLIGWRQRDARRDVTLMAALTLVFAAATAAVWW